ncbi:uncharacterized protein BDR25DRAFT_101543 [Lindgomyces ingoldianus]|uniref:Uncharacterized protein n=1 Tax=Lindgomyces ingoldianus TaxID=673940 RepID=A0ACB6RA23_9PLEO|nr:uncharacterized protein BDR25DRAFT_101543 [Lindgomyces ingoldianus]KAF2475311.1 hypothetical protein BDR25DRAFT_101543 [Lindgomyces ingoldianus]
MFCLSRRLRCSSYSQTEELKPPIIIRICGSADTTGANRWRVARLSIQNSGENIISRHLVNEILHLPIQPLDHATPSIVQQSFEGYVDLSWHFEGHPDQQHRGRFFVTSKVHPQHDAIDATIGRRSLERLGTPMTRH